MYLHPDVRFGVNFVNIRHRSAANRARRRDYSQKVGDRPGGQRNGSKRAGGGGAPRSLAGGCGALGARAASGVRSKRRGALGRPGRSPGSTEKSRGVRSASRPRSWAWMGAAPHSATIARINHATGWPLNVVPRRIQTVPGHSALRAPIRTDRRGWRKHPGSRGELPLARGTCVHYRVALHLLLQRG